MLVFLLILISIKAAEQKREKKENTKNENVDQQNIIYCFLYLYYKISKYFIYIALIEM